MNPGKKDTSDQRPSAAGLRVLLIDDNPMVREGMRVVLRETADLRLCAVAAGPEEVEGALREHRPHVVCLDLPTAGSESLGLIRRVREVRWQARVLVYSARDELDHAEACLQAGASGYVMKTESTEVLLSALRKVARGELHLSARAAMLLLRRVQRPLGERGGVAGLSAREYEVFQFIGLGQTTRQIAERLGIGIKTVETHRENIKNKLGIDNAPALVREATMWVRNRT